MICHGARHIATRPGEASPRQCARFRVAVQKIKVTKCQPVTSLLSVSRYAPTVMRVVQFRAILCNLGKTLAQFGCAARNKGAIPKRNLGTPRAQWKLRPTPGTARRTYVPVAGAHTPVLATEATQAPSRPCWGAHRATGGQGGVGVRTLQQRNISASCLTRCVRACSDLNENLLSSHDARAT